MNTAATVFDAEVSSLGEAGFFIRDGFLGTARARTVAAATSHLASCRALSPGGVRRGADRRLDTRIRGDELLWLTDPVPIAFEPLSVALDALKDSLNQSAYLGLRTKELQLARFPGNGTFYQRHRDAFPGPRNRRLTAILYLNEEWRDAHGGMLRLHLPDGTSDIEPVLDRLVVFLSEHVEHEVLPTYRDRLAVTAWFRA